MVTPTVFVPLVVIAFGSYCKAQLPAPNARGVPCIKDVGFYRRPQNDIDTWDPTKICGEYFECSDNNIVTRYTCGDKSRRFNVVTGQCDYSRNVNATNCAITSKTGRPALEKAGCPPGQLGCYNKACIPTEKFCDGISDCPDGSDEAYCTIADDPNVAPICDESACKLPNCFCSASGTKIPGGLSPEQTPQMILLSFDDAVNSNVLPIYEALFNSDLRNPNNCSIRATFYLSHQWTDYRLVQQLYRDGHDFGLHSTSHRKPEDFWDTGDVIKKFNDEFVTNQKIATDYGQMPGPEYWKAMRVPWLRSGGNRQFQFMKANNILIDHTLSAPPGPNKVWPYTLDYRMPHKCYSANEQGCPTRRFPGSWVFPINQLNGSVLDGPSKGQYFCSMMESCPSLDFEAMKNMLNTNFLAHYESNRAPLGLYFHARWFIDEGHFPALQEFVKDVLSKYNDVYFVSTYQAMNWVQNPVPLGGRIAAFDCPDRSGAVPDPCATAASQCGELPPINSISPSATFATCRGDAGVNRCPEYYPWIGNWQGEPNTFEAGVPTAAPLPNSPGSAAQAQAAPAPAVVRPAPQAVVVPQAPRVAKV